MAATDRGLGPLEAQLLEVRGYVRRQRGLGRFGKRLGHPRVGWLPGLPETGEREWGEWGEYRNAPTLSESFPENQGSDKGDSRR